MKNVLLACPLAHSLTAAFRDSLALLVVTPVVTGTVTTWPSHDLDKCTEALNKLSLGPLI